MSVIVELLNGTNLCRDAGFQAPISAILQAGVRKSFLNELAVTTGQVATGMCFIQVTRDVVSPNEVFLIPVWVTAAVSLSTSGNGWVIVRIAKAKVNDGSTNALDGTGIATVEKVTVLPSSDPYLILATLSSGVITDARTWTQISETIIDDEIYYDQDLGSTDSYAITIAGFKGFKDGKHYAFKAHTPNVGACNLTVNGVFTKSIRKNFNAVLNDNDIVTNQIVDVVYDADDDWLQMQSPSGSTPAVPSKASIAEALAGTDDSKFITPLKAVQSAITWGNVELGTIGEAVTSGDIVANKNLMYQLPDDMKWYKVTNVWQTHYYKLALLLESALINDTGKKLLRKGLYTFGTAFPSAVNPTLSASGTGTDTNVGDNTSNAIAFSINNTANPETTVSDITIRAKQVGAPAGPLDLYIVLKNGAAAEGGGYPACFWDLTNFTVHGAIIGQVSIPQASFSGVYQNLTVNLGGQIKIPAGMSLALVAAKRAAGNSSNFYVINTNNASNPVFGTTKWTGSYVGSGNWSFTVVSTPTVGYAVKSYDISNVNGTYSLTPFNPWARVIGNLVSATQMMFDPERNAKQPDNGDYLLTPTTDGGIIKFTTNFCPSSLRVSVGSRRQATTSVTSLKKGSVRADRFYPGNPNEANMVIGNNTISNQDDFTGNNLNISGSPGVQPYPININVNQNFLMACRLEQGYYLYNSYPQPTGFPWYISAASSGFTGLGVAFDVEASTV